MDAVIFSFSRLTNIPVKCLKLFIVVAVLIIIYSSYLIKYHNGKNDLLKINVFKVGNKKFDIWPLTHFALYVIIGYMAPFSFNDTVIKIGIAWEIFEMVLSKVRAGSFRNKNKNQDRNNQNKQNKMETHPHQHKDQKDIWWQANATDLLFNACGFWVGSTLRKAQSTRLVRQDFI